MQSPKLTAADAHSIAELTCSTLEQVRGDESFDLFWEKVMVMQVKLDISLPTLPKKGELLTGLELDQVKIFFMMIQSNTIGLSILKRLILF